MYALELHCDRSWREHGDVDVGICRRDADGLRGLLHGWQIAVAAAGVLEPWDGHRLDPDRHEHNLWCRRRVNGPWKLDLLVGEGDPDHWIYRRDPAVRLPWDVVVVLMSQAGVPYLAPEVQLLFQVPGAAAEGRGRRRGVIPTLSTDGAGRLAWRLDPDHPWQNLLPGA